MNTANLSALAASLARKAGTRREVERTAVAAGIPKRELLAEWRRIREIRIARRDRKTRRGQLASPAPRGRGFCVAGQRRITIPQIRHAGIALGARRAYQSAGNERRPT